MKVFTNNRVAITYFLVFLSMVFWGLTYVWTSIVKDYYNPVTIITLRLLISVIILGIYLSLRRKWTKIHRRDYPMFLYFSFFNPFLYFLAETYGVKYTSPTISAIFITAIPVFTPLYAYFKINERISKLNIIGLLISFFGILFMLINKEVSLSAKPEGVIALSIAVASAVIFSVMLKKLSEKYGAVQIITVQNFIGMIYLLPLFFIFEWNDFISIEVPLNVIYSLFALSFFGSSLAFIFYTIGTRELGVSKTSLLANMIPVITAIFSYYMLGEVIGKGKIIAIIVVLLGVFLSQIKSKKD